MLKNDKYVYINDTRTQNNWGCHSTSYHFEEFFKNIGIEAKDRILLRDLHSERSTIMKSKSIDLSDVGYIFVNGEGSIYDNQAKGLNIFKAIKILKDRKHSLKIFFMNSTFDVTEKNVNMKNALLESQKDVEMYFPREKDSMVNLLELNIKNSLIQPDFLYTKMLLNRENDYDLNKPYIVIGGNSNYYRGDRPQYDAVRAYDKLIKNIDDNIILYSSDTADIHFLEHISKVHGLLHLKCTTTNWIQAFDVLSNAKFSISGRYHPTIMSLCGNTPSYFITANNCKMSGTHKFFYNNDDNITNSHKVMEECDKIISWIEKVENNYENERDIISTGLKKINNRLSEVETVIREYVKNDNIC